MDLSLLFLGWILLFLDFLQTLLNIVDKKEQTLGKCKKHYIILLYLQWECPSQIYFLCQLRCVFFKKK